MRVCVCEVLGRYEMKLLLLLLKLWGSNQKSLKVQRELGRNDKKQLLLSLKLPAIIYKPRPIPMYTDGAI